MYGGRVRPGTAPGRRARRTGGDPGSKHPMSRDNRISGVIGRMVRRLAATLLVAAFGFLLSASAADENPILVYAATATSGLLDMYGHRCTEPCVPTARVNSAGSHRPSEGRRPGGPC